MTLFEKSLHTIELPAVLHLLADEAVSEAAKELCLKLTPLTDVYEIRELLAETGAAKKLMELNGSPSFGGVKDITATVNRADLGGSLNMTELLHVAGVLRAAGSAISYRDGGQGETAVDHLFYSLRANKYLENRISSSIVGPEEMADSASKELADIRRHMRIAGDRARQSLNKIVTSSTMAKYLQEPIITMRNDRFVVPVKAEFKGAVPGLVHDISASGATLFVEPMTAVQANNEIRELLAKEKHEIDRILAELSAEVARCGDEIKNDFKILVQLDLVFARAKLSYRLNCCEPELNSRGELNLRSARHPLLPKQSAVPVDIRLGGDFDTSLVTSFQLMFETTGLKTLDLSEFSIESATYLAEMFAGSYLLKTIYVSEENGDWTEFANKSEGMFAGCAELKGGHGTLPEKVSRSDAEGYRSARYARIDTKGAPGYFTSVNELDETEEENLRNEAFSSVKPVKGITEDMESHPVWEYTYQAASGA